MVSNFDASRHAQLVRALARSSYLQDYLELAARYPTQRDVRDARLDLPNVLKIFQRNGVSCKLDKRFRLFVFDEEEIHGWRWSASLVVQREDALEPMVEGEDEATDEAVGSTMMSIAAEVARQAGIYDATWRRLSRPKFDGKHGTMERLVPDLVAIFRSIKDVVRQQWDRFGVPEDTPGGKQEQPVPSGR